MTATAAELPGRAQCAGDQTGVRIRGLARRVMSVSMDQVREPCMERAGRAVVMLSAK